MPHLSPTTMTTDEQRLILRATAGKPITERTPRRIVAEVVWWRQAAMWEQLRKEMT